MNGYNLLAMLETTCEMHSEERLHAMEGHNLLTEKAQPKHKSVRLKLWLCLPILFVVAAVLVSIIVVFNMEFSIIRKAPPKLNLSYSNPIPPCKSPCAFLVGCS